MGTFSYQEAQKTLSRAAANNSEGKVAPSVKAMPAVPVQTVHQNKTANSQPVIQRLIGLSIDTDEIVRVSKDDRRPPGMISGDNTQGDHTTPFSALQDQIGNALELSSLANAWDNLHATYNVYKTLPGWDDTAKFFKDGYSGLLDTAFAKKGDIDALQGAVTNMLALRNKIGYTSLPKGGSGNGEAKWVGSLQYQERQIQLGHDVSHLDQNEIIKFMCTAFDHARVNNVNKTNRDNIYKQHAITITDAYPQLCAATKINAGMVYAAMPTYA